MSSPAWRYEKYFKWAIVLTYGAIVGAMIPFHEPWRDEAETWLIARDLNFWGVLQNVPYTGHPPLWNILQMPLVKLDFPFYSLGIFNAAFATAAITVLVFWSPFSLWQKAAVAFSLYYVLWYGMVWREYSMNMLAFFLVAVTYPKSQTQPIRFALAVLLLACGCVPSLEVAMALCGVFVFEWAFPVLRNGGLIPVLRRLAPSQPQSSVPSHASHVRRLAACIIMMLGIVTQVALLCPSSHDEPAGRLFPIINKTASLQLISGIFVPGGTLELFPCALTLIAFAVLLWDLRRKLAILTILLITHLNWSYIWIYKVGWFPPYHAGLMTMLVIMVLWIARSSDYKPSVTASVQLSQRFKWFNRMTLGEALFFGSLALSVVSVPSILTREIREPFSGGQEMAKFLRSFHCPAPIATYPSGYAYSILAYLPELKVMHLETGEYRTFCKYTTRFLSFEAHDQHDLISAIDKCLLIQKPWLLLGLQLPDPKAMGYELVHRSPQPAWGLGQENFWLYRPVLSPENIQPLLALPPLR